MKSFCKKKKKIVSSKLMTWSHDGLISKLSSFSIVLCTALQPCVLRWWQVFYLKQAHTCTDTHYPHPAHSSSVTSGSPLQQCDSGNRTLPLCIASFTSEQSKALPGTHCWIQPAPSVAFHNLFLRNSFGIKILRWLMTLK